MAKSTEAFRTISEVSEDLDIPKHVLRFWEAKFPQLKPMKRGGGRRFYRPADMTLLGGIGHLLHSAGYTIRGVQKILREQGVDAVKAYAPDGAGAPGNGARAEKSSSAVSAPQASINDMIAELQACLLLAAPPQRGTKRKPRQRGSVSNL
jgi:DNA-binding transcriptional MerR regulator